MPIKDPLALPAGTLRHQITFLERSLTSDESGSIPAWTDYTTTRAAIEPFSGKDLIQSGVDATNTILTITMRWRGDVDATMRIQTLTGLFIIQGIENVLERNRVLKLTCLGIGANN